MPTAEFADWSPSLLLSFIVLLGPAIGCGGAGPSDTGDGVGTISLRSAVSSSSSSRSSAASTATAPPPPCSSPTDGCPCAKDGATVSCPGPKIRTGSYTTCQDGERECRGGSWSACVTVAVVQNADQVTQDFSSPCNEGTHVRWGAFTLDGLTPANSSIAVAAQTADTQADLDAAGSFGLAQFDGSSTTSWTTPDADTALGASKAWLRVTLTLTPATQGGESPTVADWNQASTCVAN